MPEGAAEELTPWHGPDVTTVMRCEEHEPGFVVDSFGVGALNTKSLAREDPRVNATMLRRRNYDLVIFMVGANDEFTFDEAPLHMKRIIERHRAALPETPESTQDVTPSEAPASEASPDEPIPAEPAPADSDAAQGRG